MDKTCHAIKNRHNLSVIVEISAPEKSIGLVFMQHGVSGCKEEPHIIAIRDTFNANNYTVVSIDSSHGLGDSEGNLENFTATTHYHDLEDVISWASNQDFYSEPFVLAGHSMGGFSTLNYTIHYPDKVKAVAPIAVAISGNFLDQAYYNKDPAMHEKWKLEGKIQKQSKIHPERKAFVSWNFIEEFKTHDLLKNANQVRVPVLLIVGEEDPSTPLEHQQKLFEILETDKELNIASKTGHSFYENSGREEMADHLDRWIKKINSLPN
jgi:pimeloyl-ACP methyl ester carboxylesterase